MRIVHNVAQHKAVLVARLGTLVLSRGPPDTPRDGDGTAWVGAWAGVGLVSSDSLEVSSAVIRDAGSLDSQVYQCFEWRLRARIRNLPAMDEANRYRHFPKTRETKLPFRALSKVPRIKRKREWDQTNQKD